MAGTACAKAKLAAMSELPPPQQDLTDNLPSYAKPALSDYLKSYDLQQLGCSDVSRLVSKFEIMTAGVPGSFWGYLFSDISFLLKFVGTIIAIALAAALAVYVIVRAIGWVIGGFVA